MKFNISFKKVMGYLEAKKWEFEEFDNNLLKITLNLPEEELSILIPNREELKDYQRRINDLINSLSAIEERDKKIIEDEIINFGYDLLSFRFITPKMKEGTMALEYASQSINHITNIIKFEACSEINPKSKYNQPYKEAKELIENCEMIQTGIGSFIINIRIPLSKTYLTNEIKEKYIKDLGRRTINRLIKGILEVPKINLIDEKRFEESYKDKETLNKNVCDNISNLLVKEDSGITLDISARWNSSEKIDENILSKAIINSKDYFKKFKRMSVYLKKIPEDKIVTIRGKIIEMKRQEEDTKKEKRLIKIFDKNLKRNVYSWLEDTNYKEACNIHRDKKEIILEGILTQKQNGKWFLDKSNLSKIKD